MFRQLSLRHAHELSPCGDAGRHAPFDLPRHIAWQKLAAFAAAVVSGLAERRRIRRCERELQTLDDRMLRDIGVTRQSIGSVVRHGR
jgi:uncharacterized protein YjiS (DUF1127 family)